MSEVLHVYVDGSGPPKFQYGYLIDELNKVRLFKKENITNNQAEYLAIIEVLNDPDVRNARDVTIYSDSMNTVRQLNHEYAINDDTLRELAMKAWDLLGKYSAKPKFEWIDRRKNKAGKMLGS
ncbi:MAG: RNase H family protein [Nitrososphaerales archaeon]